MDLIATDPPFNKGVKAFEGTVAAGVGKAGHKVSYKDTWTWRNDIQGEWTEAIKDNHPNLYAVIQAANAAAGEDMGAFLCYLGVRVLEMHRILKPTGSLYLHIDHTAHAYAKAMLDAIFGRDNFRNEIVWCYTGPNAAKKWFPRKHDTILFYAKSPSAQFNGDAVRRPYRAEYTPARGVHGARRGEDSIEKQAIHDRGAIPTDWWADGFLSNISAYRKELTGYPTQKPLALYERIIAASSSEGDLVLDPFAGCATTCVAAEKLGREWIAIDINTEAEVVVRQRLQKEVRMPLGIRTWRRAVHVRTSAPKRTDKGEPAAPELVLVSPRPQDPRMTARELRERLGLRDGPYCQGCGYQPPNNLTEYLEVDHKLPQSLKGPDAIHNRVLLCSPCNGVKGKRLTLAELRLKRIADGRMLNKGWTRAWYDRTGRFGEGA